MRKVLRVLLAILAILAGRRVLLAIPVRRVLLARTERTERTERMGLQVPQGLQAQMDKTGRKVRLVPASLLSWPTQPRTGQAT